MKNDAVSAFNEWTEGESSFVSYAIKNRTGNSAVSTARNLEDSLRVSLLKVFTPSLGSIEADLSRPKLNESHYKRLDNAFNDALLALNNEQDKIERKINSISSKDSTVHCAKAAAKILTEYVINALKHITESVQKERERFTGVSGISKSYRDSENQVFTYVKQTATSKEALKRILAKLEASDEDLE